MRVLAIDTTTVRGSAALVEEGRMVGEVRVTSTAGHSGWLLAAVDQLLRPVGHRADDVDGFAVTVGPGSFTGLRVGVGSVQGLALGTGRPCVGLSALDVLASLADSETGPVVALMDAWRDEIYARVYEGGRPTAPARVVTLVDLVPLVPPRPLFLGDGAVKFRDRISGLWPEARILETDPFLAAPLGRLAEKAFREGQGAGPESLRPLYLRGADIRLPQAVSFPLVLEAATRADLEALVELERRSYSHPWTRRNFEGELAATERGALLVLREGDPASDPERGIRGYCALQFFAGEMHVMNLAVAPEWRKRGLGRVLLRLAKDIGARRGAREAWLEVREGNLPALALYRSSGFTEVGRRPGYYARPREDALLLRAPLLGT